VTQRPSPQDYYDAIGRLVVRVYEIHERVPCQIPAGSFPAYYFVTDFDCDTHGGAYFYPGRVLELFDYKLYKWPGHGLADDAVMFYEQEYIEYEVYRK
jgi:hypothetical protein